VIARRRDQSKFMRRRRVMVANASRVVIKDNDIAGTREGIFLSGSSDCLVKENRAWLNQSRGIMVRPSGRIGGCSRACRNGSARRHDMRCNRIINTCGFPATSLANVSSLRDFERFLRACAWRSASLLNKADLARDIGIAPSTVNQWLSVLEASGQIVLLEPWFSNRTKTIVKRLYVADSGLLCALLNIRSAADLRQSPAAGLVWETFVCAQLRHRERRGGRRGSLFFWRDRTREVDFLVDAGGRFELFEAKWTELPDESDAVNLAFARRAIDDARVAAATLVCRAPNPFRSTEASE
jgi:parallel beta-helix repeat protein